MEPAVLTKSTSSTSHSPRSLSDIEKTIQELQTRIEKIISHLLRLIANDPYPQKSLLILYQMRNELKDRAKVIKKSCVNTKEKKVLELYKQTIKVNYTLGSERVIKAWEEATHQILFKDVAKTLQIIHDLG